MNEIMKTKFELTSVFSAEKLNSNSAKQLLTVAFMKHLDFDPYTPTAIWSNNIQKKIEYDFISLSEKSFSKEWSSDTIFDVIYNVYEIGFTISVDDFYKERQIIEHKNHVLTYAWMKDGKNYFLIGRYWNNKETAQVLTHEQFLSMLYLYSYC